MSKITAAVKEHFNFFRLHLLLFTLVPLIASLVFYALNDDRNNNEAFVPYIDSLFLCVSAVTVAGLYSVVLSNLEVGQQIILAVLTAIGSYSFVSTVMVLIRRHYFAKEVRSRIAQRGRSDAQRPIVDEKLSNADPNSSSQGSHGKNAAFPEPKLDSSGVNGVAFAQYPTRDGSRAPSHGAVRRRPLASDNSRGRSGTIVTVEQPPTIRQRGVPMYKANTQATYRDRGFGGYPDPYQIFKMLKARFIRQPARDFPRSVSMSRTITHHSVYNTNRPVAPTTFGKLVSYITFDAQVGKNSAFHGLSEDQREELGGVELRALDMLAWIVPLYWFCIQAIGFVVIAPYMARSEFRAALTTADGQAAPVNSTWFSLFQVISSYANNGILIDASLVPLQKAYVLLWAMMFLILAGNTGFPVCLRFCIWVASKCFPKTSPRHATLQFLLDHPRRCFLYLLPSMQTWYLLFVLLGLNAVDWVLFLLLDINNGPIQAIPTGVRVNAGLFQAIAVRCGGFQIVSLSALAPAVQVLYVVMMYVGALPVALGVRSSNVYEDRSIALYEQGDDSDDEEAILKMRSGMTKTRLWGEYSAWHLKRQLGFDLWWLVFAIFLICIFERGKMLNPDQSSYVNVFSIVFEVVSAYGTVGLSLGVPNQNFSLSGVLGTASKLVLCVVMLRGRHRGLPDAIDRSVLLPEELKRQGEMEEAFREHQNIIREAIEHAKGGQQFDDDNFNDAEYDEGVPPGMA